MTNSLLMCVNSDYFLYAQIGRVRCAEGVRLKPLVSLGRTHRTRCTRFFSKSLHKFPGAALRAVEGVFLLFISNIYFDVFDVCNVCKACNGKDFRRTRHLACGVRRVCHLFISKYL